MLFLVEGFPSIIIAVFAWFYIPDSPETAVYLDQRARRVARLRLRKEEDINESGSEKKGLDYTEILATLADPKAYITAVSSPLSSRNDQIFIYPMAWHGSQYSPRHQTAFTITREWKNHRLSNSIPLRKFLRTLQCTSSKLSLGED